MHSTTSFRKAFSAIAGLLVTVMTISGLYAQLPYRYPTVLNNSALYGGTGGASTQSRNVPAGTVNDPGSQVLYLVDTGVNLREIARDATGDSELAEAAWANPLSTAHPSLYDGDDLAAGAISQSFLTLTNTHPTQAVTIHFRYFNDECEDLLDFLVLLTCNDTLIMDPFNFVVPETSSNTRNRIFGPASGILTPIDANSFGSGRFLIFATASGTSTDADDIAELRFAKEFETTHGTNVHCHNLDSGFGTVAGINANNLHVFNANAVAFNYLVGAQTYASLVSSGTTPISQAYGLNAWTRPAVDGFLDFYAETQNDVYSAPAFLDVQGLGLNKYASSPNRRNNRKHPDGDGVPLLYFNDWRILGGGETMLQSDGLTGLDWNILQLRAELHGGDTARIGVSPLPTRATGRQGERTDSRGNGTGTAADAVNPDFSSWWGALGTPSIFGVDSADQVIELLSIMDDYNGSGTTFGGAFANDNSYNIGPAETTYVLQIYDNAETIYDVTADADPNISPFPASTTVTLKITVDCLRTWLTDVKIASTSVESLSIDELQGITTEGGGPTGHLEATVDPTADASQGWIRLVRDNTQDGTWEAYNLTGDADTGLYQRLGIPGVFVTIGYQAIVQGGLGSAWWLSTVASDPWVSSTGDPTCDGLCNNGAGHTDKAQLSPWVTP